MSKSNDGRYGCLTFSSLIRYTGLMLSILNSLSVTQLKRAVAIKEQIEKLGMELASILGEAPKASSISAPIATPKKRTMSAAQKAKISAAQKARYAAKREAAAPQKGDAAVSKGKRR